MQTSIDIYVGYPFFPLMSRSGSSIPATAFAVSAPPILRSNASGCRSPKGEFWNPFADEKKSWCFEFRVRLWSWIAGSMYRIQNRYRHHESKALKDHSNDLRYTTLCVSTRPKSSLSVAGVSWSMQCSCLSTSGINIFGIITTCYDLKKDRAPEIPATLQYKFWKNPTDWSISSFPTKPYHMCHGTACVAWRRGPEARSAIKYQDVMCHVLSSFFYLYLHFT